jgi:Class II Aldolase and Adducin N-terminal domain
MAANSKIKLEDIPQARSARTRMLDRYLLSDRGLNSIEARATLKYMNTSLNDPFLYIYQFSTTNINIFKSDKISQFLSDVNGQYFYQIINSSNASELQDPTKIVLFLVTSITDFRTLEQLKCRSAIKIIAYFLDREEFQIVDDKKFRATLKSRGFQYIYPDRAIDRNRLDLVYPSCDKIIDTIYFKTIRNKFGLSYLSDDIEEYLQVDPRSKFAEIVQMGWYLREMALNHADSFAGGIAVRFGQGFLTTATKTDKYRITPDRICYVESYSPHPNQIHVVGTAPPSSESALFHSCFQEFPDLNVILHFHHKPITCGWQFDRYRTSNYIPYGTLKEADTVTAKLRETEDFVVANAHGEFAFGSDFSAVKNTIDRIVNLL